MTPAADANHRSATFFDQSTLPGNKHVYNGPAVGASGFASTARPLVAELIVAMPCILGLTAETVSGDVYMRGCSVWRRDRKSVV